MKISFPLFLTVGLIGTIAIPVSANPLDALRRGTRAHACLTRSDDADADQELGKFIALHPTDPSAWLNRGLRRAKRGKYDGAIADFSSGLAALELFPATEHNIALTLTARADVWLKMNEPLRALVDSMAATNLEPTVANPWMVQGETWYSMGNLKLAQACLARAQKLDKRFTRSYTPEGARQNADKYHLAHKTIHLDADLAANFNRVDAAVQAGEREKIVALLTEITEINPTQSAAWGMRGDKEMAAGQIDAAIRDYSTAIACWFVEAMPPA